MGCAVSEPKELDFVGNWVSEDGGEFKFNENGTFSTKDLVGEKMFSEFEKYHGQKINESGKWNLVKGQNGWKISLDFNKVGAFSGKHSTQFNISGEKGFASSKPPWYLFVWVGDPDDGVTYNFMREDK